MSRWAMLQTHNIRPSYPPTCLCLLLQGVYFCKMKKIVEIRAKYESSKQELIDKQKEYNNLAQIGCMDAGNRLLENQIIVLKGVVKALEWVLF